MSDIHKSENQLDPSEVKKLWTVENLPDGTLKIKRYKGADKEIVIPDKIGTKVVTAIADEAFLTDRPNSAFHKVLKKIKSVTIPDTVTHIGDYAFYDCVSLVDLVIPNSIEYFGWRVFENSGELVGTKYDKSYYLGNDQNPYVILLGTSSKSIVSCDIHPDTKFIANDAFRNCSKLKQIDVPEGVKHIGRDAFKGCKSLTKVTLPNSLQKIRDTLFDLWEDPWSVQCVAYDNALYLGNDKNPYLLLVKAASKDITSCQIHQETRFISTCAFQKCRFLTDIVIPGSVTDIGASAFSECSSLVNVELPSSVASLGAYAFSECTSLAAITIPTATTSIGFSTFQNCTSLKKIVIPDGVEAIRNTTFANCTALESVVLGKSVKSIGTSAFKNCPSLVEFSMPKTTKDIAYNAFDMCPLLSDEIKSKQKRYN